MKVVWYLLSFMLGLFGVLAVLRAIELLITGQGIMPIPTLMGLGALVLAGWCWKAARAAK
jgi:hypothetical protein